MRFVSSDAASSRHGDARAEIRRIEGRAGDIMQAARSCSNIAALDRRR